MFPMLLSLHIWTRIDGDDGCLYNINGWHIVSRIDYIITEISWLEHHDYEVHYT